jgi:hypothetical protein
LEGFPHEVASLLSDAIERFEPTFAHYGLMAVFVLVMLEDVACLLPE